MPRTLRWRSVSFLRLLGIAAALGGCAQAVDGSDASAADATPDGAVGACTDWVLTDHETVLAGQPYTDLHLTFDGAGQLERRREHIRTGGHGIDRTYREFAYQWSATGVTIDRVDQPGTRTVYVLAGRDVVQRTNEGPASANRGVTRYTRDAAGRVTERVVEAAAPQTGSRCSYRYDDAGHLVESSCSDGEVHRIRWDGDRPVRDDREWRGAPQGMTEWRWDPSARLATVRRDDGYGPNRDYQQDYVYNAAGTLARIETSSVANPARRPVRAFGYDAAGRLARVESDFDVTGAAQRVSVWERDEQGRPSRLVVGPRNMVDVRYTYEVSPDEVTVVTTAAMDRASWRYRCFRAPVRVEPVAMEPGVRVASPEPEVGHYPVAEHQP